MTVRDSSVAHLYYLISVDDGCELGGFILVKVAVVIPHELPEVFERLSSAIHDVEPFSASSVKV
jgi:hypothetical protein